MNVLQRIFIPNMKLSEAAKLREEQNSRRGRELVFFVSVVDEWLKISYRSYVSVVDAKFINVNLEHRSLINHGAEAPSNVMTGCSNDMSSCHDWLLK